MLKPGQRAGSRAFHRIVVRYLETRSLSQSFKIRTLSGSFDNKNREALVLLRLNENKVQSDRSPRAALLLLSLCFCDN